MKYCTKCGKPLQDGEVCSFQTQNATEQTAQAEIPSEFKPCRFRSCISVRPMLSAVCCALVGRVKDASRASGRANTSLMQVLPISARRSVSDIHIPPEIRDRTV